MIQVNYLVWVLNILFKKWKEKDMNHRSNKHFLSHSFYFPILFICCLFFHCFLMQIGAYIILFSPFYKINSVIVQTSAAQFFSYTYILEICPYQYIEVFLIFFLNSYIVFHYVNISWFIKLVLCFWIFGLFPAFCQKK